MNPIRDLIAELKLKQRADITFQGKSIHLEMIEDGEKIHFLASVYEGGDYIPPSVRNGIKQRVPFQDRSFPAYLTIDEERFEIHLHHDEPGRVSTGALFSQIDRFSFLAEEWREFLDQNGRGDLIHVRSTK